MGMRHPLGPSGLQELLWRQEAVCQPHHLWNISSTNLPITWEQVVSKIRCSIRYGITDYSFSLNRQDEQEVERRKMRTDSLMDKELQPSVLKVFGHSSSLGVRSFKTLWVHGPQEACKGTRNCDHILCFPVQDLFKRLLVKEQLLQGAEVVTSSESMFLPVAWWLCSAHCSDLALSGLSYLYARSDCCSWNLFPFKSTWQLHCRCKTGPCVEGKAEVCLPQLLSQK